MIICQGHQSLYYTTILAAEYSAEIRYNGCNNGINRLDYRQHVDT